jgi:hypothetical protein
MGLPSSERRRYVKIKEEFNRLASSKSNADTVSMPMPYGTPRPPQAPPSPQQTVGLNYREGV